MGGSQTTGLKGSEQWAYCSFESGISMQGLFSDDASGWCLTPVYLGIKKYQEDNQK